MYGKPTPLMSMYYGSRVAIGVANNQAYNRMRHICLRCKSVRNVIIDNVISLEDVKSERNLADLFIKGLYRSVILAFSTKNVT